VEVHAAESAALEAADPPPLMPVKLAEPLGFGLSAEVGAALDAARLRRGRLNAAGCLDDVRGVSCAFQNTCSV